MKSEKDKSGFIKHIQTETEEITLCFKNKAGKNFLVKAHKVVAKKVE